MNEFDRIIKAEKQRDYKLEDQDQFAFDTLTQIHAGKSRLLRRFAIAGAVFMVAFIVAVQLFFLDSVTFNNAIMQFKQLLVENPQYITIFNGGLIFLILGLRKLRFF